VLINWTERRQSSSRTLAEVSFGSMAGPTARSRICPLWAMSGRDSSANNNLTRLLFQKIQFAPKNLLHSVE